MRADRLIKLADFLETVNDKHFDLDYIVINSEDLCEVKKDVTKQYDCGFAACAIGWMPAVFPRDCKWQDSTVLGRSGSEDFVFAAEFFEINEHQASFLFDPYYYNGGYSTKKIPKSFVINRLRRFANHPLKLDDSNLDSMYNSSWGQQN